MADVSTLDAVIALGDQSQRAHALKPLASQLGVETVLLFARDPALGALIPAPGLPQTLRGGRTWRSFIAACPENGRCTGEVEFPIGVRRPALALLLDGVAIVLLGGHPSAEPLSEVERLLPLVAALLKAEQQAALARVEAGVAQDAASRAQVLATALELARADAAGLNAELREEQSRKDEFLAMLGHELRNPLSPLLNSLQFLRLKRPGDPIPAGIVDLMTRQTKQLARLVDDLLDVSRVSRGRIELRREAFEVGDAVRAALEESRPLVEASRHEVVVRGTDEQLVVNADRARLTQIFGNLLTNAAKYTDPGGCITVTVSQDQQNAIVRIADTGIGLSAEMLPRIFDLFAQAPGALGRAQGGLGIGLTLVRTLVELHGGRVSVESPGLGAGSTFSVMLPLVVRHSVTASAAMLR